MYTCNISSSSSSSSSILLIITTTTSINNKTRGPNTLHWGTPMSRQCSFVRCIGFYIESYYCKV